MGLSSSNTAVKEDYGDLVASFSAYFKKTETENKIISPETIHLIELNLKKGNIQGANSAISEALENIEWVPINIAVTGESGAGKSSFINALRGLRDEGEDAAEVGVVETTMERKLYKHPKNKNLNLWDLPGIGTMDFPPETYLEKVKFQEYDFFILVSASRFTKLEVDLAKAIAFVKKNYYYVRTKIDRDLQDEKESKPRTFDREKVLQQIRRYCVNTFHGNKLMTPPIFLISNKHLSDYDFPVLIDTFNKDIPTQKRHSFMISLPNITESVIDRKRESMQQVIWLEAFKTGLLATVPVVGLIRDDVEKLRVKLNYYRGAFGVDDNSLEHMAKDSQVPVEQLKTIIKSPYLLEMKKETLEETFLKYLEKFALVNGGFLAAGLYFRKTFYLQLFFLDTVTEDAKVLLRETYLRKYLKLGAGEIAQRLRALTALPEDRGSIPSTHMAAHNCLYFQFPVPDKHQGK